MALSMKFTNFFIALFVICTPSIFAAEIEDIKIKNEQIARHLKRMNGLADLLEEELKVLTQNAKTCLRKDTRSYRELLDNIKVTQEAFDVLKLNISTATNRNKAAVATAEDLSNSFPSPNKPLEQNHSVIE